MVDLFDLEVREKRRQVQGNRSRSGASGSRTRKGMRTPYDSMNARERKKLNGEVVVTKMYETIIPKEEFLLKDLETQKNMLIRWREIFSNEKIKKEMGIHNKGYYDLVEAFDLPKKARGGSKPRVGKKKTAEANLNEIKEQEPKKEIQEQIPEPKLITRGLHLEYNGDYTAEELSKIFLKLQLITEGEENKFTLAISLTERV
jgi:hypothetical protein